MVFIACYGLGLWLLGSQATGGIYVFWGGFRGFWRPSEAAPSRKTRLGLDNLSEGVRVLLTGDLALQEGA